MHPGDPFCPRCFCINRQKMGENTPANFGCILARPSTYLCSGILACEPKLGQGRCCRDLGGEHIVW